jgi:Zn-dependent peptidase ImmA (M78 family)/transcriptional regulator with XRE-family HTH domain
MATAYANINPDILRWARERADLTLAMLAKKLQTTEDKINAWENGEKPITMLKAMDFANKTLVPFGYLFLSEQPIERLPIPDLRTVDGEQIRRPSAELIKVVQNILLRQTWYIDYVKTQGETELAFVGKFNSNSSVASIVKDMREWLDVPPHPTRGSWEDYHKDLIKRIESVGVLVMRQGNLGHHTKPLNVNEFRGFAIADKLVPLIFINLADAPVARLFTLIHELSHIWIGESGVSDGSASNHRKEEALCNAVAAEFLVPGVEFQNLWTHSEDWRDNLPLLESHFHVSQWVIARRALTLNYISGDDYHKFIASLKKAYDERDRTGGGPTYYVTIKSQTSDRFARALLSETLSGNVMLRDAGSLLGVKPDKIEKLAKEFNI